MLVGVSQKRNYGWEISVAKFPNLESAEAWLNREQFDFRERFIFDDEEEALEHLQSLKGRNWGEEALEDASTWTLLDNGEFDVEMSESYGWKVMMGLK